MTVNRDIVDQAAQRLEKAAAANEPCEPVRDLIGRDDLVAAYAVQDAVTERRVRGGERVVGRKIGLTSLAVQQQLGVDRPDFGVLFGSMGRTDGATITAANLMQPRVEAEIAFVLGADLADGPLDAEQVRAATDHVVAALEVCGSRIRDWDISFADTVADNASGAAFVLGTARRSLDEVVPAEVEMTMSIDGEEASTGNGIPGRPRRGRGVAGPHRPRSRRATAGRPGDPLGCARPDATAGTTSRRGSGRDGR